MGLLSVPRGHFLFVFADYRWIPAAVLTRHEGQEQTDGKMASTYNTFNLWVLIHYSDTLIHNLFSIRLIEESSLAIFDLAKSINSV